MPYLSDEPENPAAFTERFDRFYGKFARAYFFLVKCIPMWTRWSAHALAFIRGRRVLEVSFGTGELLTRYPEHLTIVGVDLNAALVAIASRNLRARKIAAGLVRADVCALPFSDESFDTVVNTMAFCGYPSGQIALMEMMRVLRMDGRLIIVDFANPSDGNPLGTAIARFWAWSGDVIRDLPALFDECGLAYTDQAAGAFGSVRMFVVQRRPLGHV